jgi:hypothetical protein
MSKFRENKGGSDVIEAYAHFFVSEIFFISKIPQVKTEILTVKRP